MELPNAFWFTAGVATAYIVPFLWGLVERLWTDHQHNKTLTHEWDGRKITEREYQDYMDSANAARDVQLDRECIQAFHIPYNQVGYCQYEYNPELSNYWCVTHKSESQYITRVGSLLPCKIMEKVK